MEITVCMMIDVEGVSIGPLEKCTTLSVQNVVRKPRSPSNPHRTGRSTAGIVIRRRNRGDSDPDIRIPLVSIFYNISKDLEIAFRSRPFPWIFPGRGLFFIYCKV
jgi:hypothetical protein